MYICRLYKRTSSMSDTNTVLQIDVESILRAKNGGKRPPSVFVYLLTKLLYVNEINQFLSVAKDKQDLDFFHTLLEYLNVHVRVSGIENLPPSGTPCVFVSNHPLGGIDGVAVAYEVGKHYPEGVIIPANDVLMYVSNIQNLFIPINKVGGQAKNLAQALHLAYESSKQMMMFPSGMVSRMQKGKIEDPEWKKNFVVKAVEYKRNVVPIYIGARNSNLFYWVARIRKKLKIALNIEMLLLPRELFRHRNKELKIVIGNPIHWNVFDTSKTPHRWAQYVKKIVYNLK
jgi:putative hemolysin